MGEEELMNRHIPPEVLLEIVRRLVEGLQSEQIILFGSYT